MSGAAVTRAKKGIYAAAATPLNSDGAPDGDKLASYCSWLIAQGLDGVAPMGTTGEGNSLPLSFRLALPAKLADAGLSSDQVIMGTGACSVSDAAAATRASLDAGFNSVLVLPPFYYKGVSDTGLYGYYARLIDLVGDARLRVYFYHFPAMSMTPISVELIQLLRGEFGLLIAGLKDSSGDMQGTLRFAKAVADFDVFPSNEGSLIEAVAGGCAGIISATTQVAPALCRATVNAAGAEKELLLSALRDVRAAVSKHSLMAAVKEVQALRSGDAGWRAVLPPLVPLSPQAAADLKSDLDVLADRAGALAG